MRRKYKILYSLSEFMQGSMVKQVCQFVRGLNKDLFDIEICAEAIEDEGVDEIKALNVPYYKNPFFPPRSLKISKLLRFLTSPVFIRKRRFDIIHSLHYSSLCLEPIICKLSKNTKYIYSKSNLQWSNHRLNWHLKSRLSDRIVAQSDSGARLLASKGFEDKTVKIYNGVDCGEYAPASVETKINARKKAGIADNVFVFGYAAHFIEVKDHITLLKAFKMLRNDFSNITLILCGGPHDRAYYDTVMEFIENNKLSEDVKLLGTISDMRSFYAICDCLVFPSKFENFSLVILEAMSSGLPIIATGRGGNIDQVIEGENGFLIEPENHIELADTMRKYLDNPELIGAHGMASRKIAESKFSVEIMVRKVEELYLEMLD